MSKTETSLAGRAFRIVDRRLAGVLARCAERAAEAIARLLKDAELESVDREEAERGLRATAEASAFLRAPSAPEPPPAGWLYTLSRAGETNLFAIRDVLHAIVYEGGQDARSAAGALSMIETIHDDHSEQRRLWLYP
jgi:hypothetical protein